MEQFTLICLPFAGGNAMSYKRLEPFFPEWMQLAAPELPGKGSRIQETSLKRIPAIVDEIIHQMEEHMVGPYAIYGHSMGALLGHAVTQKLGRIGYPLPQHLFLSSYIAPSRHYNKQRHLQSDIEFTEGIRKLKGMPERVLNDPKLLRIFLPSLRADLEAVDHFMYREEEPHDIPMTLLAGTQEPILPNDLNDWKRETTSKVKVYKLQGDHFFIFQQTEKLCSIIVDGIEQQVFVNA